MMKSHLKEAASTDVALIVRFLSEMQEELQEFKLDPQIATQSITESFKENVHWFLFVDENEQAFGTCYMQSLHGYWRLGKRYYLGGFYIAPSHRGKGRFRELNRQLKEWVTQHNGVQIFAFIHKDNEKSLQSFAAVDLNATEYLLCKNHWGNE